MTKTNQVLFSGVAENLFKAILNKAKLYHPNINNTRLRKAYNLACRLHARQFRDSGEPFVTHPLQVALILTDYFVGEDTLISAILHDCLEDTCLNKTQLNKAFGENVANLVDGVTAIDMVLFNGTKDQGDLETIRKILKHSQRDIRVIVIKLADRLHNMRTLESKKDKTKQIKKATETMDIFVAIAARLGIWKIKKELETISFKYLFPIETDRILKFIKDQTPQRTLIYNKLSQRLRQVCPRKLIKELKPYQRGLFAFKKRLEKRYRTTPLLNDALVLEIITNNKANCYVLLGIIRKYWSNIAKSEEDFISNPRDNGYQAIHTTIITEQGQTVQYRIMSQRMKKRNWYGIVYDRLHNHRKTKHRFLLPLKMIDQSTRNNPEAFFKAVKNEILKEKINLHINGSPYKIPISATVLDSLFIALKEQTCFSKKIFINDKPAIFSQKIREGDFVKVLMHKKPQITSDWLFLIKNSYSRFIIQNYLRNLPFEQKEKLGRKMIDQEFSLQKYKFSSRKFARSLPLLCQKFGYSSPCALFIACSEGRISSYQIFQTYQAIIQGKWQELFKSKVRSYLSIITNSPPQSLLGVKIKGDVTPRFNLVSRIHRLSYTLNMNIKTSFFQQETNDKFALTTLLQAKNPQDYHRIFVHLKNLPGVKEVTVV